MKSSAGRPREFDPQNFLNTALECFWQKGYRATSMADLMKASGLASASIYKLYPDKRAIYLAALHQYMDEGVARGAKHDVELSPEAALRETLEFVALFSSSPDGEKGCFTIAAASELLPGDEEVKRKVHHKFTSIINRLERILSKGQTQQVFRRDESARVMALSIFMMLEGMRVYGKIQPDVEDLKRCNDFIVRSVLLNRNVDEKELSLRHQHG
ncbi:TetR/AcrR family transcriptional regulator [Erwiniaceae bacterium BAC15a-03b]|uniref:TetR/AcrR family transcriptional regulator n=1 Tax=Winslowiella arboricola TaxID=2978220 RepID=A0A9J6PY52_9GAMM|nr:TetR/AcrR family transcriptional regulator [Winslowiella arboricola]MCU5774388.1 TetR/AcrR family transcriptional regulator [Winslowiella arboricola]MCU5778935.1 TetR/AcrR family transcriptional regulator [Winslowiella arboricola]